MQRAAMLILIAVLPLAAGKFERVAIGAQSRIAGAFRLNSQTLYTWGDELRVWSLRDLSSRALAGGSFGEGGCMVDLDGNGVPEFVTKDGEGLGNLVWRKPPYWTPEIIDTQVDMHDCLGATLFGRRGLLTIHRYMQVRFYERPSVSGQSWPVREIYSIYTPSQQAGLALHDIDRDGNLDLYCGTYWIRRPGAFDLPWRLFAINTYSESPLSAMLRIAPAGNDLVVSQAHMNPARATWFERPVDPKLQWIDHRLSDSLAKPHGLAVGDLNGDGRRDVIVGEQNGSQSRLIVFWNEGNYHFKQQIVASGLDTVALWALTDRTIAVATTNGVSLWRYRRR